MRVPVRADGSALLLWAAAAAGAGGLTWWDAQDAAVPAAAAPRAPAAEDLVWMDAEDTAELFGLGAVVEAGEGSPTPQDPSPDEERAKPRRPRSGPAARLGR